MSATPSPSPWLARAEVRLFAVLADKFGADKVSVPLPPGSTARSVLERMARLHPSLAPYLGSCRLARDDAFLEPESPVQASDQLSAIPPTSGG